MVRTVLIVLEIIVAAAAIGGEAYLLLSSQKMLTQQSGLTQEKIRVIVDLVVLDAILVVTIIAIWQVVTEGSVARWISIIAGAVTAGAVSARPSLTGSRQAVSTFFAIVGLVVVVLGFLLPSPG